MDNDKLYKIVQDIIELAEKENDDDVKEVLLNAADELTSLESAEEVESNE